MPLIRALLLLAIFPPCFYEVHAEDGNHAKSNGWNYSVATPANRSEAIRLIDEADRMRAEWEKISIREKRSEFGKSESDKIRNIYEKIVDLTPGTELAAYGLFNIMGMHTSARDLTQSKVIYERILSEYPGTTQEIDAHMHLGLTYLQSVGKPAEALTYFEKIRNPRDQQYDLIHPGGKLRNKDGGSLNTEAIAYVRARLQMARSYLALHQLNEAENAIKDLTSGYPEAAQWIDKEMQSFRDEHFHMPTDVRGVEKIGEDIFRDINLNALVLNRSPQQLNMTEIEPRREDRSGKDIKKSSDIQQEQEEGMAVGAGRAKAAAPSSPKHGIPNLAKALLICTVCCFCLAGVLEYIRRQGNRRSFG